MTTASAVLHPGIDPVPDRMAHLTIHRGFPVPWFVDWIEGPGPGPVPEFRAMDPVKLRRAIGEKLCWVCGDKLGKHMTFVIGPMCGMNRNSAEPPSHLECARYSVKNCPFLSNPGFERREGGAIEGVPTPPNMILRNPGVTLLWTTRKYTPWLDPYGATLFDIGDPENVEFWSRGRPATRVEVVASIESGLPILSEMCDKDKDPAAARAQLEKMRKAFEVHLPAF